MGILVVLSVIFYIIFIPLYGMLGAALGSLFSISIASLLRVFYLQHSMQLFPYRPAHLKCVAIGILALAIGKIIPVFDNHYIDLFIRCSAISVVFIPLTYLFRISDDLNLVVNKFFRIKTTNR
jgi:O-antigen/teichoic acid export membrane protein